MKTKLLAFSILVLCSCVMASDDDVASNERPTCDAVLQDLSDKQGEELRDYIYILEEQDKTYFSDKEIDSIVEKLLEIQKTDSYSEEISVKGEKKTVYPNRLAVRACVFRCRFQKIANNLRALPMEQRVDGIIEGMLDPPELRHATVELFANELVLAGKEAVPFIVKHKPKLPYVRRKIVWALAEIGDSEAVPYIIETLENGRKDVCYALPGAAKALGRFKGEKVVVALIAALNDPTSQYVERKQPQHKPSGDSKHKPRIGKCYCVRHAAALSLTQVTGHDWGLVYNEDPKTWSSWLESGDRDSFSPNSVERSEKDKKALVEFLFHRYMSACPAPDQSPNALATPEGIDSIAKGLEPLGKSIVPVLVEKCDAIVADSPVWRDELRKWTIKILSSLPWDEAAQSAKSMGTKQ